MTRPAWALRLVQFQTALVVFCAGWEKWLGTEWPDGTAMYYVTRLHDLFERFPVADAVLDSSPVGANPVELHEELSRPQALPRAADLVPAGLPSELLERRPDIRQAERLLGAAYSGIRVARSQRWPKFFLTGAGGVESGSVSRFLNAASRTWIWSPGFTLPIFQLRGIRAQIRAAEARNDQALATYHQTVLLALEDVENALVRYGQAQRKEEMLEAAVADNERAVELSQTLYQEGLSDFLTVLDAERRLFEAQAQWVASETAVLTSLTGLYKSLGGGW